jgi:hypothetical protein
VSHRNILDRHASLAVTKSPVIVDRLALLAETNFSVIASEAWQSKIELEPNMTDLQVPHEAA